MTRASTLLFWFSLTIMVSLGLYQTSYRVDKMNRELRSINAQIETEQRNLHILKAEWVFLANPARIEAAARKHLALQPTKPTQIARAGKLPNMLPSYKEAGGTMVAATPIASISSHAAPRTPKVAAGETGRVNTRLIIGKTAMSASKSALGRPYRLAGDDSYGIANVGTVP